MGFEIWATDSAAPCVFSLSADNLSEQNWQALLVLSHENKKLSIITGSDHAVFTGVNEPVSWGCR